MTWSWQQTYTGRRFCFPWPTHDMVDVRDIAHALSLMCRFNGHLREFYSVAQHSVLVSTLVPPGLALAGLLHDAAEAYVGDVITPVKGLLHGYRELEAQVDSAVAAKFGLNAADLHDPRVKHADLRALALEATQLLPHPPVGWDLDLTDLPPVVVKPLSPRQAERAFLRRFKELYHGH